MTIDGVPHGSQDGAHGGAQTGAGGQGLAHAPRNSQSQQRHPTALLVSINTAVRINSFLIFLISSPNVIAPSRSYRHVNSTPHLTMCKFNRDVFSKHNFHFFQHPPPIRGYTYIIVETVNDNLVTAGLRGGVYGSSN